jgi:hypothetical protein
VAAYQAIYGLTPGQPYVVSAWIKAAAATTVACYLQGYNPVGGSSLVTAGVVPSTTAWQQVSVTYTAPANGALQIVMYAEWGSGTTYWDDVTVTPVPPVNPGFETGTIAPWLQSGPGSQTIAAVAAHSGNYGLVQTPSASPFVAAFQAIYGLTPGQPYVVSAWIKAAAATTVVCDLQAYNPVGGSNLVDAGKVPSATAWQQVSVTYTAPANGALQIVMYANWGSGTTYWDDVVVTPVPPVNPGFETGTIGPWLQSGPGSQTIAAVAARSGSYGLVQTPSASPFVAAYQAIYGLTPGQPYVVSAWIKAAAASTVACNLEAYNPVGGSNLVDTAIVPSATAWQQVSVTYTAPANGALQIVMYADWGSGTTYWDDVAVSGGSLNSTLWSNFAPAAGGGVLGNVSGLELWEDAGSYSSSSVTLTNLTRSSPNFQVGDSFLLQITGFPGQSVALTSFQNGATLPPATEGTTDNSGHFQLTGVMGLGSVGSWIETWSVGGVTATPTLSFTVSTNNLPVSPTKEYIYLNGKVVAIENPM